MIESLFVMGLVSVIFLGMLGGGALIMWIGHELADSFNIDFEWF